MYFLSRQQRIAMPTCKAQPQKVGSRADHRPVAQNLHFSSSFSSVPLCLRMIRKLPQSEGSPAGLLTKSAAERKVQKCKAGAAHCWPSTGHCIASHCCAESVALKSGLNVVAKPDQIILLPLFRDNQTINKLKQPGLQYQPRMTKYDLKLY